MQASTYLKMIAGSLPEHGQGAPEDSLRIMAQAALGTMNIHFICSPAPVEGMFHYFAVPSSALASEPSPTTQLAAALPGHPAHQGAGVYTLELGIYKVAALFDGSQLDMVCNDTELVNDLLNEQPLPVYKLGADAEQWAFQSAFTRRTALVERISSVLLRFSLITLALSAIGYGGLMGADGWASRKLESNTEESARSLATALSQATVSSPLERQMAEYQARVAVAVRAGGWLDTYTIKGGKESFRMFLPAWVTPDYITALGGGKDLVAERDPTDEQLITVTKGAPEGRNVTAASTAANGGRLVPAAPPAPPARG